jgi:DNA polymerase-1
MEKKLFLLDGMALVYRAHFAFVNRPVFTAQGVNTSALYGFTQTLLEILQKQQPTHLAVAFDTDTPTQRHLDFPDYKAQRQVMPEDITAALPQVRRLLEAFNIPVLTCEGYEADDIMGTLARQAEKENIQTFLVTGDKDFMQLISPLIRMFRPGKQGDEWEILDEKAVREKFGVPPDLVIDVLGLIGDKSDKVREKLISLVPPKTVRSKRIDKPTFGRTLRTRGTSARG